MRRTVRILLVVVAIGGLVFLFVLPGRTWLQQRRAMSGAEHKLAVLDKENRALAKQAAQLGTPAYIEQLARQQYGLVTPGQHAYGVLPATAPTTSSTTTTRPAG